MDNQSQNLSSPVPAPKFSVRGFAAKIWRYGRWVVAAVFILFVGLVIYRIPAVMEQKQTEEQIEKIRATKLTLDDVMGVNLPPAPDSALADATVEGIDANQNGIRDDVELAIFEAYPDSARTRAALLQYALALQKEFTQELVNSGTVTTVAEESGRANLCLAEAASSIVSREENMEEFFRIGDELVAFLDEKQINTTARREAQKSFYEGNLRSYGTPRDRPFCDVDSSSLPN